MAAEADLRAIYALAVRLGRFPGEVIDRPLEEVRGLLAFLEHQAKG
jgi:hypothetical protein